MECTAIAGAAPQTNEYKLDNSLVQTELSSKTDNIHQMYIKNVHIYIYIYKGILFKKINKAFMVHYITFNIAAFKYALSKDLSMFKMCTVFGVILTTTNSKLAYWYIHDGCYHIVWCQVEGCEYLAQKKNNLTR